MNSLDLDAACLRNAMSDARSEWNKRLFARLLAMVLYEGFDDMSSLLSGATREFALSGTADEEKACLQLRGLRSSLNLLKRRYISQLKPIRHVAAAHRNHDIRSFHEVVAALDLQTLDAAALELFAWTSTVGATVLSLLFRYYGVREDLAEQLDAIAGRITRPKRN